MKNLSPLQLTLYTSGIITLLIGAILVFLNLFLQSIDWLWVLFIILITFVVTFSAFRYALERFIYRKIKLIYKSIHSLKMQDEGQPRKVDLKKNIFDEIKSEVVDWGKSRNMEVDKLKETEVFRREFLANVSHELKTPIFNIQGYIHTLIDGGLQDKNINMRYLQKAAGNLDHLSDIVSDLEIISKLESGQLPVILSKFDILELINESIGNLEIIAEQNNINLKIKDGCNKSIWVLADRDKIKQVLNNLLTNSIRYGKEGGLTQIGIYDMHDNILVEVSDDGIGIPKDHLSRLFERFYRVDKARSRKHGGTGLGLSIVKHIMEAHDQNINVRSTVDVGSTFGFTLKKAKN